MSSLNQQLAGVEQPIPVAVVGAPPGGLALESKQLPDGHNVTITGSLPLPTGIALEAKQLPDNHQVSVSNPSLAITAASLPLPTGAATAANQLGDNHQVQVSNFPATQPVSAVSLPLPAGAATSANQLPDNHQVAVSNFPATQPVSAVSLPLPTGAATAALQLPDNHQVNVSNASLAITAVALPLPAGAATAANQLADNHQVQVSNFPATQPVSAVSLPLPTGAATAANQLADNHQVTVSNFPATQPVSAVSLPLPTGAATAAGQLADNHNVTVSNFPATQPVSAVALPLPAGAATAANQLPDNHNVTVTNLIGGGGAVPVSIIDSASLDAFGRQRISSTRNLFNAISNYDNNTKLLFDNVQTGTGVAPAFDASVRMTEIEVTAGTGTSDYASFQYTPYQPGKSHLIYMTFVLGAGVANVTKDVGYFDSGNGIFLRQNGVSGLEFVLRSSTSGAPVDTTVAQAAWSYDVFDGTGLSGVTLDATKGQVLVIDLQFLGMGRVRVGFDVDGVIYWAHYFLNANNLTVPYMQTATLPARVLVTAAASAADASVFFKCVSIMTEGDSVKPPLAIIATPSNMVTAANGARTHLMSIRPTLLYQGLTNRSSIFVTELNVLNEGTNAILWEVVIGANFSVAPTWTALDTTVSGTEEGTGGTFSNLTGGVVLYSGYLGGSNQASFSVEQDFPFQYPITLDSAGAHRSLGTLTLLVQGIGGSSDTYASFEVRENR